ncbi:MAG: hypothetical protein MJZ64_03865 [Paludibacteraceae bacterium]|nr:hypothetical protein [Paludibacteraceae bacterium]
MIKRFITLTLLLAVAGLVMATTVSLTPSAVKVEDATVDKLNYFITVEASDGKDNYTLAFDVYPPTQSIAGTFSTRNKTIEYVNSYAEKKIAGKSWGDMYYCEYDSKVTLTIVSNGNKTCTLSGSMETEGDMVFEVSPITFDYDDQPSPEPPADPYRFEPKEATTIAFVADLIVPRLRETGVLNINISETANETYNWIELNLIADELVLPAGTYTIDNSGKAGTMTASQGYISLQNDDPCYLAIRDAGDEFWGQYTPYYLVSGQITVAYNEKGDTVMITGEATSKNGTKVTIDARAYNLLYDPEDEPREKEQVELAIDTVVISYLREYADSLNNIYPYTFNFFSTSQETDGFPNVIVDVALSKPMELVEGTYTLENNDLSGLVLFQDQSDYTMWFFGGEPYVFKTAQLTLSPAGQGAWTYSMYITDTIGSEYSFSFTQVPHIINYPQEEEEVDPKEQPFTDELKVVEEVSVQMDSLDWKDRRTMSDPILDMALYQETTDAEGLQYYIQLGMYAYSQDIPAGTYNLSTSEEEDLVFSSSLGRYGNIMIPCYVAQVDQNGWVHKVWYLVSGSITLGYDEQGRRTLSGECTSYYGSTIRFSYSAAPTDTQSPKADGVGLLKYMHNGRVFINRGGKRYTMSAQSL